jgi:cell wall-associated NlpC family hydrolase
MTFSGIAAIQAQIQAIEQQVGAVASPGTAATAGSGSTTGADFASLLTDAMNTQTAVDSGNLGSSSSSPDSTSSAGSGTSSLSSLLGEASALTGSGSSGALDPTSSNSSALTSLVSSLTGTGTSTSPDIASLLSSLTGTGSTGASPAVGSTPNLTAQTFVNAALSEQGKSYVWGAKAPASDPSPSALDCSGLTSWAAARAGVTIPDGAAHQYAWLKEQGATMTVQQALQTPGALLFHFASEPQPGLTGEPPVAHVAISLGNGLTIEAKGHAYGVGVFSANDRFNYAGMIPGMS